MDNWLLPALAAALADVGWASVRFNFRGTGASEGQYGGGFAEVADVAGAFSHLDAVLPRGEVSPHRRALVGWSFGALVGLRYAASYPLDDWVGIAPPAAA